MLRRITLAFALAGAAIFSGCQSPNAPLSAPQVTPAMAQSGDHQHADLATLANGRTLFVSRCARCHALPNVASETPQQWPAIVARMSKRSGLKPNETQAVLAYVLAARAQ